MKRGLVFAICFLLVVSVLSSQQCARTGGYCNRNGCLGRSRVRRLFHEVSKAFTEKQVSKFSLRELRLTNRVTTRLAAGNPPDIAAISGPAH